MTKKKVFKIIISFLIGIILIMSFSQMASGINVDMDRFDEKNDKSNASNHIANIISSTINLVQIVGAGTAILMLVVLGIKWVSASSMPSVQAQITKHAKYYILGAIFIFAAVSLLQIVKNFTIKDIVDEVDTAVSAKN